MFFFNNKYYKMFIGLIGINVNIWLYQMVYKFVQKLRNKYHKMKLKFNSVLLAMQRKLLPF